MNKKEVGSRIRSIREALKLKQKEFCTKLNISDASLSELETGKYRPSFDFLNNLAKEYNANLYYMYFGKGKMFVDLAITSTVSEEDFVIDIEDVRKLYEHFEKSPYVQYSMLHHLRSLMLRQGDVVEKEIEEFEKKKQENQYPPHCVG